MDESSENMSAEEQLVERLRDPSQCRAAFGDVIKLYSEPLYRQIRRMVQTHHDADDLLQNTFMKAWQSLTFLERERKRNNISIDDEESAVVHLIESDDMIDGDELKLNLRKAVASLPEKQRLVFNMRYYDEMKYEKMSEILGTSVGALKASYHLAVKKIEQFFSENE